MDGRALDNYITGHYGEDQFEAAWEEMLDWVCEQFDASKFSMSEVRRAVVIGIAAVKAEHDLVNGAVQEAVYEEKLAAQIEKENESERE